MRAQPVLILKPNGDVAVPVDPTDLAPIAKDTSLQAIIAAQANQVKTADLAPLAKDASLTLIDAKLTQILAALAPLPKTATRATQVPVSLAAPLVDLPVDFGGLTTISEITVRDLTGPAIANLKINGFGNSLALAKGEVRTGLNVTTLHVSTGGGGGSLVLELLGR